ncbi:MAG: phosphotriesterase-related protein [Candidatus Bathyarchaeota archaeon]|nr:phosphotriesterase-related protein [Candidatus Bathyarchaeota archaeon]
MKRVQTVLGPISPDELGVTLTHEHLLVHPPKTRPDPDLWMDSVDKAVEELQMLKRAGGNSLVEMTVLEYGRDINGLIKIAKDAHFNVICTTGHSQELNFKPGTINDWLLKASVGELTKINVKEIEKGIEGTTAKAGVVKGGSSRDFVTPAEERCLRAAAKTHLETGAPIITHTSWGTMAFRQLEIFREEGVDLSRVIIGHLDKCPNHGYLRMLAKEGVNLSFDQVGKTKYYPDSLRVDLISKLVKDGYSTQILISMDSGRRSYLRSYGGAPGLQYVLEGFVKLLKKKGLSEDNIHKFFVENPKRILPF